MEKETVKRIDNLKSLSEESETINIDENKSEIGRMQAINDKLLEIIEKELEKEKVPSREVLDTITTALTITAALPWSKYNI